MSVLTKRDERPCGTLGLSIFFILSVQWTVASAWAKPAHLDIEIGTELPISVGATASATWASGLRVSTGVGYLPRTYVEWINEVVQQFPYSYDAATGDLIEETLQDSLIWRTHIGWQWDFGLYVDGGYGLAALGGGTSTEALLAGLTGYEATNFTPNSGAYAVRSVLHMADLEVGWKTLIAHGWTFRTGLGVAATFAASSTVESESPSTARARQRLVSEFEAFSERYLVDTYTQYVITPVLTIALGYRLF